MAGVVETRVPSNLKGVRGKADAGITIGESVEEELLVFAPAMGSVVLVVDSLVVLVVDIGR